MTDRPKAGEPEDNGEARKLLGGLRCLVVEDDFLIALDIQELLESAGAAAVTCAGSIADALAALQNEPPFAVAVVDIGLDEKDKTGVAVPLALHERGIPFVFLTGMGGDDKRARQFPETPVVDKPYRIDELLAALRRALRRR